jgi:hypothetical protein
MKKIKVTIDGVHPFMLHIRDLEYRLCIPIELDHRRVFLVWLVSLHLTHLILN